MISLLENSVYIGVFLSISTFWLGMYLQQKFKSPVLNPLLVSAILIIGFIKLTGYDYDTMDRSLEYINYLLTPATICLAVPLYEQMKTLKNNMPAIFLGIFSGVLSSLVSIFLLCILFGFDHAAYVTLLPKSITTPIGMGISSELGGYVPITVASIIFTGIIGNIAGEYVLKALRITNPIAKGYVFPRHGDGAGHGNGASGRRYEFPFHLHRRYHDRSRRDLFFLPAVKFHKKSKSVSYFCPRYAFAFSCSEKYLCPAFLNKNWISNGRSLHRG